MRNHVTHLATAILFAATAIACGDPGRTVQNDSRYATEGGRGSGPAEQYIKLDGCVQPGTSANGEYLLSDVVLPDPATQPNGQETIQRPPVENGQSVRLIGSSDADLKSYLGKRVEIMGRIRDTGANTLGTSGRTTPAKEAETPHEKFEQSSKDAHTSPDRAMPPTTTAPLGADANGAIPSFAVEKVKDLGQQCSGGR